MAGCRGLGSVKVEPLDYEDDADKEKSIRVKTENECYCSVNLNAHKTSDSHLTINVKEVPIEYEISIKDELDVGPTVLQPTYSSGSPVDTIEEKQSPVSSSAMLYWKRRAMTSAERTRKYRKRKREAAGSNIAKSASTISESEENPHRDLQPYILQLTDIKFRTKPKTSAERMREYRKRKREATSLNFINIASTNDCVLDLKENQGLPHDDHKPYIMVELRTEPKSSTERGREYRKRKKKGAAVYETERSCTKNMWSEVTTNDAAARKDERFLHVPDGTRKDSLLTLLSTGLTSSSELIFGTATSDENRELERQYVTPGAAETAAGCYRLTVEEKCEDLPENNDNLDENSKSDEADTPLLIDQVSIINDGIIVEESSNVDDPLRLNDARDRNEDVISEDSSIMERTSRNNEELKSSKKRVRKLLANRKQSAKSRKGTNQEARPPKRMRRATKKNSLTFEGKHLYSENTTNENCTSIEIHHGLPSDQETTEENANKSLQASQELDNGTGNLEDTSGQNHVEATQQPRSRREQDPRRAAAPISTRDMIVSRSTADGKRLLACGLCNTEFRFMSRITKHLRSHTGEKPFRCEECDARFKLPHHLTQHRRTHTGERPYRCDLCDMTFRQTAHLIIHKRTHTGEKPYRCGICGARFRQSGSLTYHEQKHAGERREYCCDMCDGKFKDADGLSQHKRTHKREGLEYGVYRVKFKQSRPLVGHRRAMKVFQVVGF